MIQGERVPIDGVNSNSHVQCLGAGHLGSREERIDIELLNSGMALGELRDPQQHLDQEINVDPGLATDTFEELKLSS